MFVQIELDERFGLPFEMGSILNIFQCMKHDDPFEELDTQFPKKPHNRLPNHYWEHSNYAIFLSSPERQRQLTERDPFLGYSKLFVILKVNRPPVP